jgi:hypothetical protein
MAPVHHTTRPRLNGFPAKGKAPMISWASTSKDPTTGGSRREKEEKGRCKLFYDDAASSYRGMGHERD